MDFNSVIKQIENQLTNEDSVIVEDALNYSLYSKLSTNYLDGLIKTNVKNIFEYLGDSFTFTVTTNIQESTVFTFNKGIDFFLEEITSIIQNEQAITISFKVNKPQLIARNFDLNQLENYSIRIFSSSESFYKFFTLNSLKFIETNAFENNKASLFIISDISEIYCNNTVIIIGESLFKQELDCSSTKLINSCNINEFTPILQQRDKLIQWNENKIEFLTPDYLFFENITNISIKKAFNHKLVDIVIMFFTDSVKFTNDKYSCRFNGYKTSTVILNDLEIDIPQVKIKYLYELYKWVYESNTCDKLMITRNIISKYLKENEEENYSILLNCIEEIDNVIKANYSTFFQDKIDSFFEDRKKIAQYTFEKSTQIEKEINSLTDSMTKNIITAIGVIITAIIANSNKQGFTNNSIKIILLSYLVYLIISTIYHIVPAFFSIIQLNGSNSHLIKYYTAFLPEKEVKNIQGNLLGNKRLLFWIYWILSLLIMISLICGTSYSLIHLDEVLKLLI